MPAVSREAVNATGTVMAAAVSATEFVAVKAAARN